jgi:hypothetical protein
LLVFQRLISPLLFDGLTFSVNRNVIPKPVALTLYQDHTTLLTEVDVAIDPRVIGFLGYAGSKILHTKLQRQRSFQISQSRSARWYAEPS